MKPTKGYIARMWQHNKRHVSWKEESGIIIKQPTISAKYDTSELKIERNKAGRSYSYDYKKVRPMVLERDGNKCTVCNSDKRINVHHIIERSACGTNNADNLVTLCYECHKEKHKTEPVYALMCKRDYQDLQNAI